MEHVRVKDTDLRISRLVLGAMTFGNPVDDADAAAMTALAAEAGITMIDTANSYGGGKSEAMIGRLLAGRRDEFQLATKVGNPHADAEGLAPLSRPAIQACVRGSLDRLGTDHVDVYYLHLPDRSTPLSETLETLAELVTEGVIGQIGVSNYAAWQLAEMRTLATREGWPIPTISQPMYNLIARRIEDEYVEFAANAGLINIVYNPLAGGLLTGKHRIAEAPADGRFGESSMGSNYRSRYWNEDAFRAVDVLQTAASRAGLSLIGLAFRWLLAQPATDAVLIGSSTPRHLADNLRAAEGGPLDPQVLAACDAAWSLPRGSAPAYNR